MEFATSIPDARARLLAFMMSEGGGVEASIKAKLMDAMAQPSPVDQLVGFGEAIYASRASLSASAREVGAMAIAFADQQAWHGLQNEERGQRIVDALLRADGPDLVSEGDLEPLASAVPSAPAGSTDDEPTG